MFMGLNKISHLEFSQGKTEAVRGKGGVKEHGGLEPCRNSEQICGMPLRGGVKWIRQLILDLEKGGDLDKRECFQWTGEGVDLIRVGWLGRWDTKWAE